ncbi:MAG: S8 family peptidase [Candidatus Coatesbacteria bacterium]|nr:MAG: S8 family peptidase [Candidatus Coatesbacteria bacterium]
MRFRNGKWVAVAAFLACAGIAGAAAEISPALLGHLATAGPEEFVPITIALDGGLAPEAYETMTAGLDKTAARELVRTLAKERAGESQRELRAYLAEAESRGAARGVKSLWAANVVAAEVRASEINSIVGFKGVRRVNLDAEYPVACGLAWGVEKIGANRVWDELYVNGKDVVVAVTDTGVDYEHTDLADRDWVNENEIPNNNIDDDNNGYVDDYHGWNTYNDTNETRGGTGGHGTHCAGSVCGDGTAGTETGVAPGAFVMPVQVLSNSGSGTESGCWEGMEYAFDNGADVTSMSLGWMQRWNPDRKTWRETCETLIAGGMVYSIAAGNERRYNIPPPDDIRTPGDVPAVITVGATDSSDVIASFSSYGPVSWSTVAPWNDYPYPPGLTKPDVSAPGVSITSCRGISGGYSVMSGTSMATPHVAGFAALILEVDGDLTNAEVRKYMEDYALDLGDPGKDNDYGSGRVRCYETINAMKATPVKVLSFEADAVRGGVALRWTTGGETKTLAGFNIYRRGVTEGRGAGASSGSAAFEKVNAEIIKGKSPYRYGDADVESGRRYEYVLEDVDLLGRTHSHGPVIVRAGGQTKAVTYWLAQSTPNPTRDRVSIAFGLAEGFAGRTVIDVYDVSGRHVETAVDSYYEAGTHNVELSTASWAPGVYVYRIAAGPFHAARPMVVTR